MSFRRALRHVHTLTVSAMALTCVLLAAAPMSAATPGEYTVAIPTTNHYPGWWSPAGGTGPFRAGNMYVETGQGSFSSGAYRRWRLEAPGRLSIVGGRIRGRIATPNSALLMQLRQGSDGNAIRTLLSTRTASSFDRTLVAWHDWMDIGLTATSATSTESSGSNRVSISSLTVDLHDPAEPQVSIGALPDADHWLGNACQPVTWTANDHDSGLWRIQLRNTTTEARVHEWSATARVGMQPGPNEHTETLCLGDDARQHGVNDYSVTVADRSGQQRVATFRLRFDRENPVVSGVEKPLQFTVDRPTIAFGVTDRGSGVASVTATIDGVAQQVTGNGSSYSLVSARSLNVGNHDLVVTARDTSDNATVQAQTIAVGDVTAPALNLTSPGSSGDSHPWLVVTAHDSGSSVDAWSWNVSVNGKTVPAVGGETGIAASLGTLAPGIHSISISVADVYGNRATLEHRYEVESAGGIALGGKTGIFVATRLHKPLVYGHSVRVRVTVLDHGSPVVGHRVVARLGATSASSEPTDATGMADLRIRGVRTGTLSIASPTAPVGTASMMIRVAPAITIHAHDLTPAAGQAVRITGRVRPGLTRRRVSLQARIGDSWYPLRRSVRVHRGGRFRTSVTSSVRGVVAVRVRLGGRHGWATSLSNVQVLRVH